MAIIHKIEYVYVFIKSRQAKCIGGKQKATFNCWVAET